MIDTVIASNLLCPITSAQTYYDTISVSVSQSVSESVCLSVCLSAVSVFLSLRSL